MDTLPKLIAVSGLAGAGKTTAVDQLEARGCGEKIYVGRFVLDQLISRKLPPGPESEKLVRLKLREERGPSALAQLAATTIQTKLQSGKSVLLDALLSPDEFDYYCAYIGVKPDIIFISASFDTRAIRLSRRSSRAMSEHELRTRDQTDCLMLRTEAVAATARNNIQNEGTLDAFYADLAKIDWLT